uniref:Variant surface glycoprotein 1331 n=1 Tax=Trypanosoma brucei TaxID=5691 RepID=M4SW62_9TRYP|nr:variant surface glycoprotein 1331 [Trypanosoma brucei]
MIYLSTPTRLLFKISVQVALLLITSRAFANIAKDGNVRERGALCGLIELDNKQATLAFQPPTQNTDLDDILELNMSVSEQAWMDLFRDKTEKEKIRAFPDNEFVKYPAWKERWNKWQVAASNVIKPGGRQAALAKHKLKDITPEQEAAIRPAIQRLAAEAAAIADHMQETAPPENLINDSDLQQKLNEAIYGDPAGADTPSDASKLFKGAANGAGPQASCEGDTTTNKAVTVTAALLCVCTNKDGASNDEGKACEYVTGTTQSWTGSTDYPNAAAISEAVKLRDLQTKHHVSAETLAAKIGAVTSLIRRVSGAATFGKTINGGCTGSQDGGMCVKYTDLGNDGSKKYTDIPWLRQVAELVTSLRAHEKAVQVRHQAANAIMTMRLQAQSLIYSESPQPREQIQPKTSTPEKNKRQRMRTTQRQQNCMHRG